MEFIRYLAGWAVNSKEFRGGISSKGNEKNHPKVVFGNAFGNKAVVLPQTLVIPIDLAEEVRFELTEDFHPRQFSRLVHSTALPLFLAI